MKIYKIYYLFLFCTLFCNCSQSSRYKIQLRQEKNRSLYLSSKSEEALKKRQIKKWIKKSNTQTVKLRSKRKKY